MLSLRLVPRNIANYFKLLPQQLHTSLRLLAAKDSSSSSSESSSDSSDSDSDKEDEQLKKLENTKTEAKQDEILEMDTNTRLNFLLQKLADTSKKSKSKVNVSIKPKKERFIKIEKQKPENPKPFEEQLAEAAKDAAKSLEGDPRSNEIDLLSQILNLKASKTDGKDSTKEESEIPSNLSDLISGMKIEPTAISYREKRKEIAKRFKKYLKEPSISELLLHKKSQTKSMMIPRGAELNVPHASLGIFKNIPEEQRKDIPYLSTWEAVEKKEMKMSQLTSPQNAYEELILWTEQGKLWNFPINNEQGMEEEEKVHFSEHVFLEKHIKDWCPRRGPIRHFMELVCVGLSKNHYLTVEEKIGHITWYKNYFEDKKVLLDELGVLDDKSEKFPVISGST